MNREETVQMALTSLEAGGGFESDNLLQALFEYAPDAYYLSDSRGKFISGNKAAEALVGYRREELVGKSFMDFDLLPKGQVPKALKLLALNVMRKPTGPDEFTLRRKDGSLVLVEIRTRPVNIKGKTVVLGIARDITERKKSQRSVGRNHSKAYQIEGSGHSGHSFHRRNARPLHFRPSKEGLRSGPGDGRRDGSFAGPGRYDPGRQPHP